MSETRTPRGAGIAGGLGFNGSRWSWCATEPVPQVSGNHWSSPVVTLKSLALPSGGVVWVRAAARLSPQALGGLRGQLNS